MINDPNELIARLYPVNAGSGGEMVPADGSVTTPKLASDVRNLIDGKAEAFDALSGGTASSTNTAPGTTYVRDIKWLMLGDSITDLYNRPQNYPYWIKYRSPWINVTNMGIGGSLVCWDRDNSVNGRQVVNIVHQALKTEATASSPDVITIFAGVNDYIWGVPLGTMEDIYNLTGYDAAAVVQTASGHAGLPSNKGNFYQAYSYLIKTIKQTYGATPIVAFTPLAGDDASGTKIDHSYGHTIGDFQDAVKAICGYWGVPCCDLGRESIITQRSAADKTVYFIDSTHPNGNGSLVLSRIIEAKVRQTLHMIGKDL